MRKWSLVNVVIAIGVPTGFENRRALAIRELVTPLAVVLSAVLAEAPAEAMPFC